MDAAQFIGTRKLDNLLNVEGIDVRLGCLALQFKLWEVRTRDWLCFVHGACICVYYILSTKKNKTRLTAGSPQINESVNPIDIQFTAATN